MNIHNELIEAVKSNDLNRVKELVEKGANVNHEDKYGITPLRWAAHHNDLTILKYLREKGAK